VFSATRMSRQKTDSNLFRAVRGTKLCETI